ncbi:MAG: hypothetical protein QMD43_02315 [Thermodesulfovibrio sp.]|uniref:DVU0772 family protein n=1 Tax=unclassified Thermodesulfovibrio TaxID=2645936 RepID=UPI00083AD1FE|nr:MULTISPECIES: hypothetical protein [unclassified Thermodesulfovibrio]MDI1471001.1 hypothetical protein [Thermodesulfovibrio sp. 1176]MDI6713851.1 hypothetical protein [Thermodesulfovibrio sp.]ODA43447.1 hypothetical protein THER_1831 [Thermodesulfovibrio sp. N1]
MIWEELLTFEDIKKETYYIQNILWDYDPTKVMEPIVVQEGSTIVCKEPVKGYVFYIETSGKKPELFLMMHKTNYFGETIAKIDEIPQELINEAVEENKSKIKYGICPINEKIKLWLKKELGLI